ncbi:MAG TPA: glycerate kinase [Clostridiales bacterium]|nr:glycerate kinase [Clostridiales bacterium]
MNKVILIPDSFKGTMSSSLVCDIMEKVIKEYYPNAEILKIPVADGGEGSVDAFIQATGGTKRFAQVKGPYFDQMESFYGVLEDEKTAVIEMAACAGLPLVGDEKDPSKTTTFGVGQLILEAVKNGAEHIIMGLGGSATNDCGTGAAAACGVTFYDKNKKPFIPVGGTLKSIHMIDATTINPLLKNVTITTMCDIDNPLYGINGAAHIFGPQKGASPAMVEELDKGLRHVSEIVEKDLGIKSENMPGAGAAGGMGYGMHVFFGSTLQMGIETVLDTVNFDELVKNADYIFTGEGKIDSQSIRGKVVIGVARRAKKENVPVIAIVGDIGDGIEPVYDMGVSAVFSINRVAVDFKHAKLRSQNDLALTMDNLIRFMKNITN